MARKKGVRRRAAETRTLTNTPPILAAVCEAVSPLLDERPKDAMTSHELARQARVGVDVIRQKLKLWRAEGVLREARVKCERGSYTILHD